jgi:hypothetical protein
MKKKSRTTKESRPPREDAPAREYDFRGGVRGKYAHRYAEGSNVVVLEPDVAKVFPDSGSVNEALRALVRIAERKRTRAGR